MNAKVKRLEKCQMLFSHYKCFIILGKGINAMRCFHRHDPAIRIIGYLFFNQLRRLHGRDAVILMNSRPDRTLIRIMMAAFYPYHAVI